MIKTATVVKHTGSHYLLTALPQWELFPAVLRGRIRLKGNSATNPVAVGDTVSYELPDNAEGIAAATPENPALITGILPRKNYIIRRSTNLSRQTHIIAANVDRAFIVATLDFPEVKLPFLDRLLVTCEVYNVPVTIVLNKCDLYGEEHKDRLEAFHNIYEGAGYQVMEVSAMTGEGILKLRKMVAGNPEEEAECIRGNRSLGNGLQEACLHGNGLQKSSLKATCEKESKHITLFSGVSGVGKSSLIKALDPTLEPRVGEISEVHLQGRHTTTFYEMYCLSSGGHIIDTPGIRGFGLVDLRREEIALYFPEMLKASQGCRFTPCTHTHEPGCAVKAAVEDGTISCERYSSYLGMLEDEGKYR